MRYGDERPAVIRFGDELAECIDGAPDDLTLSEMIGEMELQLHCLKNRFMGYKQAPKEAE